MANLVRILLTLAVTLALWSAIVWVFEIPHFILPSPDRVLWTLFIRFEQVMGHAWTTWLEIIAGLGLGIGLGLLTAALLSTRKSFEQTALPILAISQALPVFALAPLLMLWFGYGFASKLAMTTLIVYFPVTAATLRGFATIPAHWDDTCASLRATPWAIFWTIRVPMAIPSALSGCRIAASVAPIGAVVGEWVGSSSGLGYLMLTANARGQTDLMFAALLVLCIEALCVWALMNRVTTRLDQRYRLSSVA